MAPAFPFNGPLLHQWLKHHGLMALNDYEQESYRLAMSNR
jgi:hypothetical protein